MRSNDFDLLIKKNRIRGKIFYPSEKHKKNRGIIILCHGIPGGKKEQADTERHLYPNKTVVRDMFLLPDRCQG